MEGYEHALMPEHLDTPMIIDNLASIYLYQGRWKEAKELQVQVMESHTKALGLDHHRAVIIMDDLASIYRNQGRFKEAEDL